MALQEQKCIGRESNPGLAESCEILSLMATANFTTKPPMLVNIGRTSYPYILFCSHDRSCALEMLPWQRPLRRIISVGVLSERVLQAWSSSKRGLRPSSKQWCHMIEGLIGLREMYLCH
jgi:hypothetical protein